jgi:hypothetical protein
MQLERFRFQSWDGALVRDVYVGHLRQWVQYPGTVQLACVVPWLLPPMPSCSICRTDHGSEIAHACE